LLAEADARLAPAGAVHVRGGAAAGRDGGQALGLDGMLHRKRGKGMCARAGGRRDHPTNEPSPAITAAFALGGGGGGWKSKGYVRRLTPLECLRLQSGPDDFAWPNKITKTAMYRVVGNGWASGMAAQMSAALAAADPGSRAVVDLFCGGGLGACGWHGRYWAYDVAREAVPA
jgi:site-specific DNA-cytosine methylase